MKRDRKFNELVMDRLAKITGQKPTIRKAKKAVASFKTRIGDPIGVAVTLRGKRMYDFLDKTLNVSLPRTKDFRGINRTSLDNIGNMTFGIKEHTIFPEIHDEELKDIFGMAVTIGATAKTKEEAIEKVKELNAKEFKECSLNEYSYDMGDILNVDLVEYEEFNDSLNEKYGKPKAKNAWDSIENRLHPMANEEETKKYVEMVSITFYDMVETDVDLKSYREKQLNQVLN